MTDTELGKLVNAAFDDVRFVGTIRDRLRTAITGVIADYSTDADVRAGRMAGEDLATLLVSQRPQAGLARAPYAAGARGVGHRTTAVDDAERRARAFRTMAGVGL
jgi:hypothetical protein